jgi:glycosyltransferase involved in cell wall biosynthesis
VNAFPRTLFITVDAPFPPSSGAPLRNWQNICAAASAGPVAVLSIGHDETKVTGLPGVTAYAHVTLPRTAEPGVRGFPRITGIAAKVVTRAASAMIASFSPSVTVLENIWIDGVAPLARMHGRRLIYDAHNVYAALAGELHLNTVAVRKLEWTAVMNVDDLWVCSEEDARRMRHAYPIGSPVHVIPNGVDTGYYSRVRDRGPRAPREAINLLFVGAYWYEPNRIAAELLLNEVVPALRARTDADVRLVLVGAAPSEAMRASRDPGLVLAGRVPDVRPYLSAADAIVVPLQQGGGTRLKLLEAFAACRPVVATAKAAEGINVCDGRHLLLRETPAEMADAVLALHRLPDLAAHLTREGYDFVAARHSWSALGGFVRSALVEAALRARDGAVSRNGTHPRHFA